jgi:hypothetical protein
MSRRRQHPRCERRSASRVLAGYGGAARVQGEAPWRGAPGVRPSLTAGPARRAGALAKPTGTTTRPRRRAGRPRSTSGAARQGAGERSKSSSLREEDTSGEEERGPCRAGSGAGEKESRPRGRGARLKGRQRVAGRERAGPDRRRRGEGEQGAEPFGTSCRGEGWGRGSVREFDRSRRHEPSRKPIDRLPGRWAIGVVTQDSHFAGSTPDRGSFEARAPQAVPGHPPHRPGQARHPMPSSNCADLPPARPSQSLPSHGPPKTAAVTIGDRTWKSRRKT